jgi:MFS family permease
MSGVLGMQYFIKQYTGMEYPQVLYPDTTSIQYTDYKATFKLPAWEQSLTTSILSAGTFFGAIMAGDIADFIGRRTTIIAGCLVFTVGCILETASTGVAVMAVGRVICGFGVGFISAIVILYMSEIAPKAVRGALVAGYQFCITIGILLANCIVYATQNRLDTGSYRIPIALQFLWAIIVGLGLFFLPESPRYFVKKGKHKRQFCSLSSQLTLQQATSRRQPRPLPQSVANLSNLSTSRTSWPRSSPTTSTRCPLSRKPAISVRGRLASRVDSATGLQICAALFSVSVCR